MATRYISIKLVSPEATPWTEISSGNICHVNGLKTAIKNKMSVDLILKAEKNRKQRSSSGTVDALLMTNAMEKVALMHFEEAERKYVSWFEPLLIALYVLLVLYNYFRDFLL